MYEIAVTQVKNSHALFNVSNQYKTQYMCNKAVQKCLCSLIFFCHECGTQEMHEVYSERNPYFLC